jgi:hypothetical protein
MSYLKPFNPVAGATQKPSVSTTATVVTGTNGDLPKDSDVVVFSNTDSAIVVFVRVTPAASASIAVADQDLPVLPGQQIRITCPSPAKYSIVAASGTPVVYVTPGHGN